MNKEVLVFSFSLLFFIIIISSASASLSIGNPSHSIESRYGASQNIIGWINISIANENANSFFSDLLGNNISLMNLLKQNSNADYTCAPKDCGNDYSANAPQTSKTFTLNNGESKVIGLKFLGDVFNQVNSFSVKVSSNAGESSAPQLSIDILNDKNTEWSSYKASNNLAQKNFGCYNDLSAGKTYTSIEKPNATTAWAVLPICGDSVSMNQFCLGKGHDGGEAGTTGYGGGECAKYEPVEGWVGDSSGWYAAICYDDISSSDGNGLISTSEYCNKVTLGPVPSIILGARIAAETGGNANFRLTVDDLQGNYKSCTATASQTGDISCSIGKYFLKEKRELFVCISTVAANDNDKYKINYINDNECRDSNDPNFEIYARPANYLSVGEFNLNNTEINDYGGAISGSVEDYINNWIFERYNNNCANDGCVVPIKFTSSASQSLTLSNLYASYDKQSGNTVITTSTNQLYDISEIPARISLSFGKLYLDSSDLKVKNSTGNFTYKLSFNGQQIFSQALSVEKAPIIKGLSPRKTAYAFPTKFEVSVDSSANVSSYEWDFGDNTTNIIASNNIIHVYNNEGVYRLKVTVRGTNNVSSSRTFVISVTSPGSLINSTLIEMNSNIEKVKSQINSYDLFYRAGLSSVIDTNNLSLSVKALEDRYKAANESSYYGIVSDLLKLKIPEEIAKTITAPNFIFYPKEGNVNVDVLKGIEGGNYNETDSNYVASIYAWNTENMGNKLVFEEISATYSGAAEPVLKVFKFTISEKKPLNYNSFFVIKDIENLKFKEDYNEADADGYKYIELTGGTKEIFFSTTEDVNFDNLPAFIAPPLSRLAIVESGTPTEEEFKFNWPIFIVAILALLAVGVIVYIILQKWYKRRYEGYLFKNKNDLYNLFNFIELQRKKGTHESEIHGKLKRAGWNSEQIKYSMKKHSGLRTGMLEIPVDRLFEKFGKKSE